MKDLLTYIAQNLVEHPQAVTYRRRKRTVMLCLSSGSIPATWER